jgi:putative molybdopterin biosynthesis protein
VAASIASGRVDAGLGIAAAAQALGLDFIPLFQESYQLIIPQMHYQDQLLAPLLEILSDSSFQQAVAAMPGYNVAEMGKVVAELPSSG